MEDVVMEEKMDFEFTGSLKNSALVKMALDQWTNDEVLALIPKTCDYVSSDTNLARNTVRRNVRRLQLPELMLAELWPYIWSVWTQISQWYEYLYRHFGLRRINPAELRWTPHGTIDAKNSVLVLLNDGDLAVETRFRLACNFCFTEEIPKLMKKLPEGENPLKLDNNSVAGKLVIFWTYYFTGELRKLSLFMPVRQRVSPAVYAFQAAVSSVNATAAKFLFENILSAAEKKMVSSYAKQVLKKFSCAERHCFDVSIPDEFFPALACFLLSELSGDEQTEVFQEHPKQTLRCLLVRPYHRLFAAAAERISCFIGEEDFDGLLLEIFERVEYDNEMCEFRDLFRQFWKLSSSECRNYVMEEGWFKKMVYEMLKNGEEKICEMMLAELDAGETAALALDADLLECFYVKAIQGDKWYELDFFLRQCALSEDSVWKIRNMMIVVFKLWAVSDSRKQHFFRILDSNDPGKRKKKMGKKSGKI